MRKRVSTKCPYEGKLFLLPNGKVITSRCCKSPYCKRCCWYRKWKIRQTAPHQNALFTCFQSYLVLPYYKPLPKAIKKAVNNYFWRGMRAKFGPLAYIHSLEQQGGLLHGNWHLLSDKRIDKEYVFTRWSAALNRCAKLTFKVQDGYCDAVIDPQKVTEYVVKYYDTDPESYLPDRGMYRKLMYVSRNYNQYVIQRAADTLIANMFDCEDASSQDKLLP